MPIFDFTCLQCHQPFELLILKDNEIPQCPECGSRSVSRQKVALFSCTGMQVTKRLKSDSENRMKKGLERMKGQQLRKDRIKII